MYFLHLLPIFYGNLLSVGNANHKEYGSFLLSVIPVSQ